MQQLTLHVGRGADAAYLSDLLIEMGAYSASVTDRYAGTRKEQKLMHAVIEDKSGSGSYASQNVLTEGGDGKFDVPVWTNAAVNAYFPEDVSLEGLIMSLFAELDFNQGDEALAVVDTSRVADEVLSTNWVAHVQQQFDPVIIGSVRIRAPWHAASQGFETDISTISAASYDVVLEPGMAFGTGEHPTTQLIIKWLQDHAISRRAAAQKWTVLDYGCGSGILAITSLLLGAEEAVGCDIDEQAAKVATVNAQTNNCGDVARFGNNRFEADLFEKEHRQYSVVLANILAVTLKELAPVLASRVEAGGVLVVSGVLCDQAIRVSEVFAANGITMTSASVQAGWMLIVGTKPS